MLSFYDYLNIAFYLFFILAIGIFFARKSKNTSDYFRGGGVLPWWVTGASLWMYGFSAWTFTGAAGKIYSSGIYVLGLYYAGIIPLCILLQFTCYRFRRMRLVTPIEGVRLRFGAFSQQFLTWIRLPLMLIFGGFGLNAIGVFMAGVLDLPVWMVLIGTGLLVLLVSLLGGAYGVAASDFVQMFLVVTVTVAVTVLAIRLPEIGGLTGLLDRVPESRLDFAALSRPEFFWLWAIALTLNGTFGTNSIDNSSKFLMAQSDRHARMTVIIPLIGSILTPLLWAIPPLAATIVYPDLSSTFPQLLHPEEGAFLAVAMKVLPDGMLGLLVCAIFAATLTTMDGGLNQGAGIFVRNYYLPIVNPQCPEKRLLIISKLATAAFGVIMIMIGLLVDRFRTLGLFDLMNQVGVSLMLPLTIPLCLGLFFKRTPSWSTWSTTGVGFLASIVVNTLIQPEWTSWIPMLSGPFTSEEITQYRLFITVACVIVICVTWFFFTSLFYNRASSAYKADVEEFFRRLNTPVVHNEQELRNASHPIARAIGCLMLVYGTFLAILALIPNVVQGRVCYLLSGGVMLLSGLLICRVYRLRSDERESESAD